MKLTLVINNPAQLLHGYLPLHRFGPRGGSIGSAAVDWRLEDRLNSVRPNHCDIRVIEGRFCVIDRSGRTYVNGHDLPLERHVAINLNDGDRLQIGAYQVAVQLGEHLIESERPDGRIDRYLRNLAGQLTDYIDPANQRTQYHYDPSGRIQQRIDALGQKVRFSYDAYGRLQQLSNENDETYRFKWDALDRLTAQADLDGSYRIYHYNAVDDITGTDAHPTPAPEPRNTYEDGPPPLESDAPIRHRFSRDAVGRLLRKTTDDGITDYAYDAADNLLAITFKAHNGEQQQLKFRYDALGQLLSESSDAGELGYRYDALGNLETLTLPDQRQLNHLYYGSGHLHQLNLNGRVICDFERDPLHDEVLRTQGSLLTRTRYDRSGRLNQKALHYRNAAREELPLLQKNYQYDASDNLIIERLTQTQRRGGSNPRQSLPDDGQLGRFLGQSHGKSVEGNEHYSYDATERLRDHRHSTPQNPERHRETYNYDAAANLLPTGRMGGYVKHNRVHVFEDKRYRYDRFGRLSEKRIGSHTVQRFRYDAEQRLVCVEQDQGWQRLRSEYRYDPLGRRIGKQVYRNESEQAQSDVQFVWQGLRLLQEVEHGFGSVYVYADPDSYEPLARIDGRPGSEEIFYLHTNLAGLPEQLTDENGLSVWHSEYEGWGKSRDEWRDQRIRREQNLRFQGQYLDRETGLHYNTFRFYDAEVGRFTQPDPIGLLGGLNLYRYAPNSTGWIDPWGLSCRHNLVGRTPGKKSRTGKAVIARMRAERRLIGSGKNMMFQSRTDNKWYSIKEADMAHRMDAVKYWNQKGGYFGAKSKEVRGWMRDSDNYELEYYGHNRSQGGQLQDRYMDAADFIGPTERPQYQ